MTVRYLDPSTGRWFEGESVFDGRSLPGQEILDESCWRNSGSFRELIKRSGNKKDWPTTTEMKGKARKAKALGWKGNTGNPQRALTEAELAAFKADRHHLSQRGLARRYRISEWRTRQLVNAMKKGAAA